MIPFCASKLKTPTEAEKVEADVLRPDRTAITLYATKIGCQFCKVEDIEIDELVA